MSDTFRFEVTGKLPGSLARTGLVTTPHGVIATPAFITVGTKGTVKALSPEQVEALGAQAVLGNTYHLYLEPGVERVERHGGLGKFMGWSGPTVTDSGGFQVFSLGHGFDRSVGKVAEKVAEDSILPAGRQDDEPFEVPKNALARIDEDGVTFRSHIDGSEHRFTPESSMELQHAIGADMMFAFDECTSPGAPYEYQKEALERTHRWAARSLAAHRKVGTPQALFGVVQGGRFRDLREASARALAAMDFDGFGIGGSFDKEDVYSAVGWVNALLPEGKPRHLLGIGEPEDLFGGVENGIDMFDCVAPTRLARNGTFYTKDGKISITNAKYRDDMAPIEDGCDCYTCFRYTRSYVAHLFRAKEMFAATLGSIHNLRFIVRLVDRIRAAVGDGSFFEFKKDFLARYRRVL